MEVVMALVEAETGPEVEAMEGEAAERVQVEAATEAAGLPPP